MSGVDGITRADIVGTALAVVAAGLGLWARNSGVGEATMIVISVALFVIGTGAVLWAYSIAVQRSRRDRITVAELYLLAGPVAPARVRWRLLGLWFVQLAVGIFAAVWGTRGLAEGQHNSAAFCALSGMFGLGMNGWWVARHGTFPPRQAAGSPRKR